MPLFWQELHLIFLEMLQPAVLPTLQIQNSRITTRVDKPTALYYSL
jgi:hypothetical protein